MAFNGYLYYAAEDEGDSEPHLWRTDGQTIEQLNSTIIDVDALVLFKNNLYFEADEDGVTGNELFMYKITKDAYVVLTDGTSPLPSATVTLSGYDPVVTDQNGQAVVPEIVPSDNGIPYTIEIEGYKPISNNVWVTVQDVTITEVATPLIDGNITGIADIAPGTDGSNPGPLYVHDGVIYFAADDGPHGKELWKTDGTESGTVMVKDIRATEDDSSSPNFFFTYNGEVFFSANEAGTGNVLYKTDGTEAGTVNAGNSFVFNPLEVNGTIYFINTMDGSKLYTFDGSTADAATNAGTNDELVLGANFTSFNDKLLLYMSYGAEDDIYGKELYEYDLATGVYSLIKDINGGTADASISEFTHLDSKVYFEADNYLWVTDGTETGTVAIDVAQSIKYVRNFYAWNGLLFFEGDDGNGDQLWVYNPADDTVTQLSNNSGNNKNHDPSNYVVLGDYVYYSGEDSDDSKSHLWRTDGTSTVQLDEKIIDVDNIAVLNNKLYFEGEIDGVTGNELFMYNPAKNVNFTVTDGTTALEGATVMVEGYDIATTNPDGKASVSVVPANDIAYTISLAGYKTIEGTVSVDMEDVSVSATTRLLIQANIQPVKDIEAGEGSGGAANLFVFDNHVYFAADDVTHGRELWKSDGTESGTVMVKDIRATEDDSSSPNFFFTYNGELFFSANEGTGNVLYKTDGTEAGTVNAGVSTMVFNPLELNSTIYFINTTAGNKLYTFDGTTADAADNAGTNDELVLGANFTSFNDKLLLYMSYGAEDDIYGKELYQYDPATGVYTLIKDIDDGTGDASISEFTHLDSKVYFEADSYLWVTDGTEAGTIAIDAAQTIKYVRNFYAWNGLLFFEGDDGNGDQLWVYNPDDDTVTKLSNIDGDNGNHDPENFVPYGDYLYYTAEDADDSEKHLWRTDGSTIEQIDEVITDVDDMVLLNNTLYFEGDNGVTGRELYKFYIGEPREVTFVVTDGNAALEGATVTLTGYNTVNTGTDGVAVINGVAPSNDIQYTIELTDYATVSGTITVEATDVTVTETMSAEMYNVQFNVNDGIDVLDGATVTLSGYDAVTTNANGVAVVSDVASETDIAYTITLNGYNNLTGTLTVTDSDVSVTGTLVLTTYTVTFTVTDGTNALSDATVTLTGYDAVVTNASGEAAIENVEPATSIAYTVTLDGYENGAGTVDVADADVSETVELTIINSIQNGALAQIRVYPIPAKDIFYVENYSQAKATITLRDIAGRVIETRQTSAQTVSFDVSSLAKGVYLLDIMNNSSRTTKRIVVE